MNHPDHAPDGQPLARGLGLGQATAINITQIVGAGVFRPQIVRIRGNYDDVNRLCSEIGSPALLKPFGSASAGMFASAKGPLLARLEKTAIAPSSDCTFSPLSAIRAGGLRSPGLSRAS